MRVFTMGIRSGLFLADGSGAGERAWGLVWRAAGKAVVACDKWQSWQGLSWGSVPRTQAAAPETAPQREIDDRPPIRTG